MKDFASIVNLTFDERLWWRETLLIRKWLLEDRLPAEDDLNNALLDNNNFDGSAIMGGWIKKDEDELESIRNTLDKLQELDGDLPPEVAEKVKNKIKDLEAISDG